MKRNYQYQTGLYVLPQKFPNDLRLMILRNMEKSKKLQSLAELLPTAQSSSRYEKFVRTIKALLKNKNWAFPVVPCFIIKTKVCLKYVQNDCLRKQFLASNSPHTLQDFIYLTNFVLKTLQVSSRRVFQKGKVNFKQNMAVFNN